MELLVYLFAVYGYITLEYLEDKFVYVIVYALLLFTGVLGLIIWRGLKNRVLKSWVRLCKTQPGGLTTGSKVVIRPQRSWIWTVRLVNVIVIALIVALYAFVAPIDLRRAVGCGLSVAPLLWYLVRSFQAKVVADNGTLKYYGLGRTWTIPVSSIHLICQSDATGASEDGWLGPQYSASPEIILRDGRSIVLVALGGHNRLAWERVVQLSEWAGLAQEPEHGCRKP